MAQKPDCIIFSIPDLFRYEIAEKIMDVNRIPTLDGMGLFIKKHDDFEIVVKIPTRIVYKMFKQKLLKNDSLVFVGLKYDDGFDKSELESFLADCTVNNVKKISILVIGALESAIEELKSDFESEKVKIIPTMLDELETTFLSALDQS